jgi:hypothetical protein
VVEAIARTREFIVQNVKSNDLIELRELDSPAIRIIDADPNSNFFFEIKDYKLTNGHTVLLTIRFLPYDRTTILAREQDVVEESFISQFQYWETIIKDYDKIALTDEEKILKAYEKEFFIDFEIIENNEDDPFNLEKQIMLDEMLGHLETNLINYPESDQLKEIIDDTRQLRQSLTSKSKGEIMKGLSKLYSKIRKHGLPLLKEFYSEFKKEAIKQLVKGAIGLL